MENPIVEKTRAAGVVGGGGAGFPAHVKINAKADTVLINGASCEPLLCSDVYLMENKPAEVIKGLELVMESVGAAKGMICLKKKHEKCISILTAALKGHNSITVFPMDDFYPGGDEHVTVNVALGRIVPEGGIPLEVGVVVSNVESVFNITAAMNDTPVTYRTLNVAGEVAQPIVVRVPVGMLVADVIRMAGGMTAPNCKVIDGGPMMGRVLDDPESSYVTKTTSGLIVLPDDHNVVTGKTIDIVTLARISKVVCCNCTLCTELCPRYLLGHNLHPHLIMRTIDAPADHPIKKEALLCSECGICEKWSCPMHISPREVNAYLKKQVNGTPKEVAKGKLGKHPQTDYRRVPVQRLMGKLNILQYNVYPKPQEFGEVVEVQKVGLYLQQHIGAPSIPVVKVGDIVQKGQLVADIPPKALGATLHASITGKVAKIDDKMIHLVKE
ncbi:4Fe-4S dicluster domain-containing protein [Desulforhopalus sp. 52FAK]